MHYVYQNIFSARGNDADAEMSNETYQRKKKCNKNIYNSITVLNNITSSTLTYMLISCLSFLEETSLSYHILKNRLRIFVMGIRFCIYFMHIEISKNDRSKSNTYYHILKNMHRIFVMGKRFCIIIFYANGNIEHSNYRVCT
jgi:hypothetical protein